MIVTFFIILTKVHWLALPWHGQCNHFHISWRREQIPNRAVERVGLGEALDSLRHLRRVSLPGSRLLLPAGPSQRHLPEGGTAAGNHPAGAFRGNQGDFFPLAIRKRG